jgi:hypothetical protein
LIRKAVVETRVVDQPFQPTVVRGFSKYTRITISRSSSKAGNFLLQSRGVFDGRIDIVDRTRPDHYQQAVVGAVQDAVDVLARFIGRRCSANADRKFAENVRWRDQFLDFPDANVVGVGLALQGHEAFS